MPIPGSYSHIHIKFARPLFCVCCVHVFPALRRNQPNQTILPNALAPEELPPEYQKQINQDFQTNGFSIVTPPQSGIFSPCLTLRFSSIKPHWLSHFCVSVSKDFFQGSLKASNLRSENGISQYTDFRRKHNRTTEALTRKTSSRSSNSDKPTRP